MKLTIIGASGHGKVVAEIASLCGYNEIDFLDDNETLKTCGKWPVVGKVDRAAEIDNDLFIAIGNPEIRRRLMKKCADKNLLVLIHPSAVVSQTAKIGRGTVVMAGAVINPYATLGDGCIVNTCASVDHDCVVGDYVHVAVGAHLCGTVTIGNSTWIGAGATVSNNISITDNCTIGAGAIVVNSIMEEGTYIGVPARIMSKPRLTGGGYNSARIIAITEGKLLSLQRRRAA